MGSTSKNCQRRFESGPCRYPVWRRGRKYCILHDPDPQKSKDDFNLLLRQHLRAQEQNPNVLVIDLSHVFFPQPLDWSRKRLPKGVRFSGATFWERADFSHAKFTGDAIFGRATFSGNANFSGATFSGKADFSWATLSGDADLSEATFRGDAHFSGATFRGNADFSVATFSGDANFGRATFSGDAHFSVATFSGNAYFWWATFSGNADFSGATFSGAAGFFGATFRGDAYFGRATFSGNADFSEVTFGGQLVFQRVNLSRPQTVHFWHVDLSRASFLYTDVREVKFLGATWPPAPDSPLWPLPLLHKLPWLDRWPRGRRTVYDHHLLLEEQAKRKKEESTGDAEPATVHHTYRAVAELFRQLRLNLEASRQEIEAGDFYIGQMDMRRLDPDYELPYRALLWAYRAIAMYGESYLRPFFLYALVLAPLFALAYWLLGDVSYFDALFAALTAGALFREVPPGIDHAEKLLVYGNALADIFLLGLSLVALRRRFQR